MSKLKKGSRGQGVKGLPWIPMSLGPLAPSLILAGILFFAYFVYRASSQPGTETDPVVSKSFLEFFYRFKPVTLKPNQSLILGQGAEAVIRVGKVKVLTAGSLGLADLTEGKDAAGNMIPGHLYLCPRGDGRGLKAQTPAVVLVRGSYEVR